MEPSEPADPTATATADGRFTFSVIHSYLSRGEYPASFSKEGKYALRKRAACFTAREGGLFYLGGAGSKQAAPPTQRLVIEEPDRRARIVATIHNMERHCGQKCGVRTSITTFDDRFNDRRDGVRSSIDRFDDRRDVVRSSIATLQ